MYELADKAGSNDMFLHGVYEGTVFNFQSSSHCKVFCEHSVSAAALESHLQKQCWSTNFWNLSYFSFLLRNLFKREWDLPLTVTSSPWDQKVKMMFNCCLTTAPYCYFHSLHFHSKQQALFLPITCLNIYPWKLFSYPYFSLLCRRKKMCTFVSVNTSVAMGASAGAMIICLQLPHLLGAQLPYLVTLIEGRMNTMHVI